VAKGLIEFFQSFNSWQCGLNQLMQFKGLSFSLH